MTGELRPFRNFDAIGHSCPFESSTTIGAALVNALRELELPSIDSVPEDRVIGLEAIRRWALRQALAKHGCKGANVNGGKLVCPLEGIVDNVSVDGEHTTELGELLTANSETAESTHSVQPNTSSLPIGFHQQPNRVSEAP